METTTEIPTATFDKGVVAQVWYAAGWGHPLFCEKLDVLGVVQLSSAGTLYLLGIDTQGAYRMVPYMLASEIYGEKRVAPDWLLS
jgi:hypothetical protein